MTARCIPLFPLLVALLIGVATFAPASPAAAEAPPDFMLPPMPVDADASGFLYGTVTTTRGERIEGRLRWDDEEAFWGDFFNSSKQTRPYVDLLRDARPVEREPIKVLGFTIGYTSDEPDHERNRYFVARFGDIDQLELRGRNRVIVTLKSDLTLEVRGGSNDVGAEIWIWSDDEESPRTVPWHRIRTIAFAAAPDDAAADVFRIMGAVTTRDGTVFRGGIQWDLEECVSIDKLDGDDRDGDRWSIPMGAIASIEREGRDSSRVTLRAGEAVVLDGTNDVDDSMRGVFVEDPRFGRVQVSWDAFARADFDPPGSSGPAYDDYPPRGPLSGTVETRGGQRLRGRIAFDLDEAEGWEMLDGTQDGVEYAIPFSLVKRVTPRGSDRSEVELHDGTELTLEDSADVGDGNAGVAVVVDDTPRYVAWDEIASIVFDAP